MSITITVPESLEDITLGQFQKLSSLEGSDEFVAVKTLEIVTGISPLIGLKMSNSDREKILRDIATAFEQHDYPLKKIITIDGEEYGFHPNLDAMSFGEFIDIQSYQDDISDAHLLMSILYRKVTKRKGDLYEIKPYEGTHINKEKMKRIPCSVFRGVQIFFYSMLEELLSFTLDSLENQMTHQKGIPSSKLMDGMQLWMSLRETISSITSQSRNFHINSALPALHIYKT